MLVRKAQWKNSGGEVKYRVEGSVKVATILDEKTGFLQLGGQTGVVTVYATQFAAGNYDETTIAYQLTVLRRQDAQLKWSDSLLDGGVVHIDYGKTPPRYTAQSIYSSGDVLYVSSDVTVAVVSQSGQLSILKPGNTVIKAYLKRTDSVEADEISYSLQVSRSRENPLSWSNNMADKAQVTMGCDFKDVPRIVAISADPSKPIQYRSLYPSVAKVDASGNLTVFHEGRATIVASQAQTDKYNASEISYDLLIECNNTVN